MPLVAAICCLFLAWKNGTVWEITKTDASYIVTNLYLIAGLILAGMAKVGKKRESRKSKNEPTGSGKVSSGTEGESSKDK